uniref:Integrase catalytic domain-containing protein n=1 Tax=Fagus sylvatica TaxID=28930 RepID=A0A2N9FB44_FAGSY
MEEEAVSENNLGGARLPTFNHRRVRSEVRAPGGQRGREEQRSYGRIEGRHHSPSKEPSFLGEARKKRRIEELEEELRLLREEDKEKGDQRWRKRSRSHSGSCGSPKRTLSHKEHNRRSKHRHQRSVSPKRRKLDRPKTPPHQHQHNPVWKKLHQISSSPFSAEIERAKFPARFVPPPLAVYDGKSDPVGHLSRYRQSMALHTSNDPLMCRIFPSSLGEVGLRWFDRLDHRSIRSWQEMSESFTARFITNTRKPKEIDALLALKMKAGETLKSYSARYWESRSARRDEKSSASERSVPNRRFGTNGSSPPEERVDGADHFHESRFGGSAVEIMYESLFKGLGLEKKDLSLVEGPLSGFSGETIVPTGKTMATQNGCGPFHTPPAVEVPNPAESHGSSGGPTGGQTMPGSEERLPQEKCAEKLVPVSVIKDEDQRQFLIGDSLSGDHRTQLLTLLEEYQDVFAWTPYEAPGVDPEFASHALNVSPEYKPVVQKARRTAPQHAEAVREEVERLLKVGAVREILYPQWLSNTVVVKKKNEKWRVCVDFTDLNKACPKDPFPLPKIDQLVDSTAGHERMSFLDAFQGYHQIALRKEDQEKTAFITPRGIFCYKVMPFGLKNAGATYQRMVTKMFSELLGKTVELYIDDMVVKSVKSTDHVGDLRKVFEILRRHNLKLNATKCAFRCRVGEVPGFLSNAARHRGKPGPNSSYPRTSAPQERQGRKNFAWNEESDRAFERLKRQSGQRGKSCEMARGEQQPVYYTSKTMSGAETRYLPLEKSALALFTTAKKLPHYFQAHTMIVPDLPTFEGPVQKFGFQWAEQPTIEEPPRSAEQGEGKSWWTLYVDGAGKLQGLRFGNSPDIVRRGNAGTSDLLKSFDEVNIERVGREHNGHADSLAGLASSVAPDFRRTIAVEVHDSPSIMKSSPAIICQIEAGPSWMDPILNYLTKDVLPADQKEAAKIRRDATRYWVSREGKLYKKSYTGPYLLCVHPDLVPDLLYEIHEGVCGGHTGGRSLAHRAIGQGYWWPYMQKDAAQYVRRCEKCQLFAPAIHKPASQLNPISSPWPFAQCLISDNGTQFDSGPFKKYCSEFGIRNHFSSPAYPQGNGQAESSNKTILNGIKKRLEEAKGRWVEELPTILWTFRTTPRSSTGETPFSLTYGLEDMDLAQERRDLAMIRLASYQGDLKKKYGRSINARSLATGDMVLRRVLGSKRDPSQGKLGANWEGPYQVVSEAGLGAFNLKDSGTALKSWPRPGALPVKPQVVWQRRYKTLMVGVSSVTQVGDQNLSHASVSWSSVVWWDGIKSWPAMLGNLKCALPVKPQVVWQGDIKTLAMLGVSPGDIKTCHARCLTCESSSRYGGTALKSWPRPGALPVKPQVVWQSGNIKTLAMLGVSPVKSSSGMVGRHQNPGHAQVRTASKTLATPRSFAGGILKAELMNNNTTWPCQMFKTLATSGFQKTPTQEHFNKADRALDPKNAPGAAASAEFSSSSRFTTSVLKSVMGGHRYLKRSGKDDLGRRRRPGTRPHKPSFWPGQTQTLKLGFCPSAFVSESSAGSACHRGAALVTNWEDAVLLSHCLPSPILHVEDPAGHRPIPTEPGSQILSSIPGRIVLPSWVRSGSVPGASGNRRTGQWISSGTARTSSAFQSAPFFSKLVREEDGASPDVPSSRRVGSRFLRFIPAMSGAVPSNHVSDVHLRARRRSPG